MSHRLDSSVIQWTQQSGFHNYHNLHKDGKSANLESSARF